MDICRKLQDKEEEMTKKNDDIFAKFMEKIDAEESVEDCSN